MHLWIVRASALLEAVCELRVETLVSMGHSLLSREDITDSF